MVSVIFTSDANSRKAKQKIMEGHQHQLLEFEARHKTELSRTKKYLETEILQISTSLDSANKTQAELVRANKALTNRLKVSSGHLFI